VGIQKQNIMPKGKKKKLYSAAGGALMAYTMHLNEKFSRLCDEHSSLPKGDSRARRIKKQMDRTASIIQSRLDDIDDQ
jgi:hypothetical protein